MPSSGEGFGLAYLEAMAHAKPCLGGKVDAAPNMIQDRITGILVDDPRSPDQIALKIIELFSNPKEREQWGPLDTSLLEIITIFHNSKSVSGSLFPNVNRLIYED